MADQNAEKRPVEERLATLETEVEALKRKLDDLARRIPPSQSDLNRTTGRR